MLPRKQVTILFADLEGPLKLLADRDPEESRTLLNATSSSVKYLIPVSKTARNVPLSACPTLILGKPLSRWLGLGLGPGYMIRNMADFLTARHAKFKHPKKYLFVDELPRKTPWAKSRKRICARLTRKLSSASEIGEGRLKPH